MRVLLKPASFIFVRRRRCRRSRRSFGMCGDVRRFLLVRMEERVTLCAADQAAYGPREGIVPPATHFIGGLSTPSLPMDADSGRVS